MISEENKNVLGLQLPSDPRWVNIAEKNIGEILIDHAWCEQKAASSCISMIIQYPEKEDLVAMMTSVVAEEWGHFRKVLKELEKRNIALGKPRKDEYVAAISQLIRKGTSKENLFLDRILLNALIEARSCERFRLLSLYIADDSLKVFYHELMVSEASHYKNFIRLAKQYIPETVVMDRWREMLKSEAEILNKLVVRSDRLH